MLQQLEPLGGADRMFRKQTLECSDRLEPAHVQEEFGDLEVVFRVINTKYTDFHLLCIWMSSGPALHRGILLTHVLAQPQTFSSLS